MTGSYVPGQGFTSGDPRLSMARALLQTGSSTAPVLSPLEGMARALTGVVGGYIGHQAQRQGRDGFKAALGVLQDQNIPEAERYAKAASAYSDIDPVGQNPIEGMQMQAMLAALKPPELKVVGKAGYTRQPDGTYKKVITPEPDLAPGTRFNDTTGQVEEVPNFGKVLAGIKGTEARAEAQARADVETNTQGTAPFPGKSPDAAALNLLVKLGRLSPEEAAAWQAGKVVMGPNGQVDFVLPQSGAATPPGPGAPPAPAGAPGSPSAAPPAGAPTPAPSPQAEAPAGRPPVTVVPVRAAPNKEIPANIQTAMLENVNAMRKVDDALAAIEKNPDATGFWKGLGAQVMPGDTLNMVDPDGAQARVFIADIGSLKIHDRSGAAVAASEFPRLKPFVPAVNDDHETVKTKLKNFRNEYMNILREQHETWGGAGTGYKPNPVVERLLAPPAKEAEPAAGAPTPPAAAPGAPPPVKPAPAPAAGDIPKLTNDPAGHAAYAALPKGAKYYDDKGQLRVKP